MFGLMYSNAYKHGLTTTTKLPLLLALSIALTWTLVNSVATSGLTSTDKKITNPSYRYIPPAAQRARNVKQSVIRAAAFEQRASQQPKSANVPPVITQCFYENRWYLAGSVLSFGRSGNLCYGGYCDIDGHVKYVYNYNCPTFRPPQQTTPKPTTTPKPLTTKVAPTTIPPVAPTPTYYSYGCFYMGRYYLPGADIENRRRGPNCFGIYCDFKSRVQKWNDYCTNTVPPIPVTVDYS